MPAIFLLVVALSACACPLPAESATSTPADTSSATLASTEATAASSPEPAATSTPQLTAQSATAEPTTDVTPCVLPTVVAPTVPAEEPGYAQLDPTTGLHMTGKVQQIDLESYRLQVTGKVDRPLSLTYDDLRCMPQVTASPVLVCPGFFEDIATWSGVPLRHVLNLAGVQTGTTSIRLFSADGYSTSVSLQEALPEGFLAYEWEGEPLPVFHGFPLRAVFPGVQGNRWAKWLVKIEVY